MRDRLQRKKKTETAGQGATETPAPLQPVLPDPVADSASENQSSSEAPTTARRVVSGRAASESSPAGSDPNKGRKRRRRGRGGRGRVQHPSKPPPPLQPVYPEPDTTSVVATPESAGETAPSRAARATPIERRPRASKGAVTLAIGLPGSGKSTWFKRHAVTPLSSDLVRSMLFDDATEQRFQDLVFSTLRALLRARLLARRPVNHVDATNLSPHERRGWIKMAHDFGYEVQAVYFDVPLEVCMERNQRRQRVVAEDVMRRMAGKLRPPTFEEGFSKITVVRVKKSADPTA